MVPGQNFVCLCVLEHNRALDIVGLLLVLHLRFHHLQAASPDGAFEWPICAEVAGLGALEWRNLVDVDRIGLE